MAISQMKTMKHRVFSSEDSEFRWVKHQTWVEQMKHWIWLCPETECSNSLGIVTKKNGCINLLVSMFLRVEHGIFFLFPIYFPYFSGNIARAHLVMRIWPTFYQTAGFPSPNIAPSNIIFGRTDDSVDFKQQKWFVFVQHLWLMISWYFMCV
jgi:hypothetical protein